MALMAWFVQRRLMRLRSTASSIEAQAHQTM
jgi:hypothetical protein